MLKISSEFQKKDLTFSFVIQYSDDTIKSKGDDVT